MTISTPETGGRRPAAGERAALMKAENTHGKRPVRPFEKGETGLCLLERRFMRNETVRISCEQ